MGKFSKPRNTDWYQEEIQLPVPVPDVAEPEIAFNPAEEQEIPAASGAYVTEAQIPEEPETDAFFDTPEYTNRKKTGFSSNKFTKVLLICLCAILVVAMVGGIGAFAYLSATDPNDGKILNNVSVAGVNIGNMTKAEAKAALKAATDDTYSVQPMVIKFPGGQIELRPEDTGAKLNVNAVIDAAYEYGRTGTKEEREQAMAASMNAEHPIALLPYLNLNLDYIRQQLDNYAGSFNSIYEPSSVTLEGEMPILDANNENFKADAPCQNLIINLGSPGRKVDANEAYKMVLDAYSFNKFLVDVRMGEAEQLPEPIDIEAVASLYMTEPKDAIVNSETYEVIMEVYGYGFDLDYAKMLMETSTYGDILCIPMSMVAPKVTGSSARDTYFRDVLCEYQTEHTDNKKRNINLDLACKAINGTILDPGEEFDFNTVVGKRTSEKGYQYAPAYSSGKTVPTLGGGICQVSSTIYYCTLIADLEIINRQPHSFVSSYMPLGMDATVSWNGPEFTFKNNTNYPIRIETWVSEEYVHCKLLGTDEKSYYVEMEYDELYRTSYDTVYETYAPDNAEGYYDGEVIQTPYRGVAVQTYKLKYDKVTKELISREEDQKSVYKNRDRIIVSIEQPKEPPKETTPTTPTTPPSSGESGGSGSSGGSSGSGSGGESGSGSSGSGSGSESGGSSSGSGSGGESGGSSSGSGSGGESGGGSSGSGSGGGSSGSSSGGESGGGSSGGSSGGESGSGSSGSSGGDSGGGSSGSSSGGESGGGSSGGGESGGGDSGGGDSGGGEPASNPEAA